MRSLPIEPHWQSRSIVGSKRFDREDRRNRIALIIARHANEMILECPDKDQYLSFGNISHRSGYTFDEVKDALSLGDDRGFRVLVTEDDRDRIRRRLASG